MKNKIRVKLVSRNSPVDETSPWRNQIPSGKASFGNCIFTFNPLEDAYDWLVIIDDVPRATPNRIENLSCHKDNTILITTEPSSVARYGRAFAKQFGYLLTNQDAKVLPHRNAISSHTGNLWFYGKSYDQILEDEPKKTKLISTVCSSKQQGHTMHKLRFEFTKKLQESLPDVERFGHGVKWIKTKAEALDPYKFHVAVENYIAPHVWTEKLADAFLGYTVPIYCGCPNVYEYFPKDSIIQIDINDIDGSIDKIKKIVSIPGEYERRLDSVKEARRRVLEEYNLMAMINKIVTNSQKVNGDEGAVIYSRKLMRFRYLPDLFRFVGWKIGNFLKGLVSKVK
jgi:hypothetical protein